MHVLKRGGMKMTKLIALDDGHGLTDIEGNFKPTPGKRTPRFEDGTIMYENEFNRRVVELLNIHLKRCEFGTLLVAPSDADTPLKERTELANVRNVDIYVCVHANALTGKWGSGGQGIETFIYRFGGEAEKAARIIHSRLLQRTQLMDRGVKKANFFVLKKTIMPALLVECGFMDNRKEAELLRSEQYRIDCAEEIAKGICEYYNVKYIPPIQEGEIPICKVEVNQTLLPKHGVIINGKSYVPIRAFSDTTGVPFEWSVSLGKAIIKGEVLETTTIIKQTGYAWSREIAEIVGLQVKWEDSTRTVYLEGSLF